MLFVVNVKSIYILFLGGIKKKERKKESDDQRGERRSQEMYNRIHKSVLNVYKKHSDFSLSLRFTVEKNCDPCLTKTLLNTHPNMTNLCSKTLF